VTRFRHWLASKDVNEAKISVSSLELSSIRLGSCATKLLNERFVDMKLYSIIKRYILANIFVKRLNSLISAAGVCVCIYKKL
jgi:hypothetical protein